MFSLKRCSLVRNREGVAFLEFTILFPLLLVLAVGVFEFGHALQNYHRINKSVRDAARFLARQPISCTSAGVNVGTIDASIITEAKNLAMTGEITGGTLLLDYWTDPNTVTISVDCNSSAGYYVPNGGSGATSFIPTVKMQASVPYADIGFLTILNIGNFNLTARHNQIGTRE